MGSEFMLGGHVRLMVDISYGVRYLNDVYTLEVLEGTSLQWECPNIEGPSPCPRESHTSVTLGNKLLVYGGMNGKRLGDLWLLNVGKGSLARKVACGNGWH